MADSRFDQLLTINFRHRSTLLLVGIYPSCHWLFQRSAPEVKLEAGAGALVLILAGVLLRLSAIRRLGKGARVHRAHASLGLSTSGPFAWSRNPLYVAAAFIISGLSVLAGGSWPALAMIPFVILLYTPVVLHEERSLAEQLGSGYQEYCKRVSRWFGLPDRSENPPEELIEWSEVLRRERGLIPGVSIAGGAVVLLRGDWLPIDAAVKSLETKTGAPSWALVAGIMLVGAVINVVLVERKSQHRAARRIALAEAEAKRLAEEESAAPAS